MIHYQSPNNKFSPSHKDFIYSIACGIIDIGSGVVTKDWSEVTCEKCLKLSPNVVLHLYRELIDEGHIEGKKSFNLSPSFGVWQPIETALKNEVTLILATDGKDFGVVGWSDYEGGAWIFYNGRETPLGHVVYNNDLWLSGMQPTHWMPLPDLPN